jgi:hypothetical protein
MTIFPVNIDGIRYATAQLVARRDGKIYMMQIPGIPTTIALQGGKTLRNVKPKGSQTPVYGNICLLSRQEAECLFLEQLEEISAATPVSYQKTKEAGPLRTIVKGRAKVAEAPSENDWLQAAVYRVPVEAGKDALLRISYRGDCARLYADGKLVADNFYYGRPFLYGLWRLPAGVTSLELRILPLQPTAPIYLPREADKTAGEQVTGIDIIRR